MLFRLKTSPNLIKKKEIETRGTAALTAHMKKNVPKAAFPVSFLWVWKTFKELSLGADAQFFARKRVQKYGKLFSRQNNNGSFFKNCAKIISGTTTHIIIYTYTRERMCTHFSLIGSTLSSLSPHRAHSVAVVAVAAAIHVNTA